MNHKIEYKESSSLHFNNGPYESFDGAMDVVKEIRSTHEKNGYVLSHLSINSYGPEEGDSRNYYLGVAFYKGDSGSYEAS